MQPSGASQGFWHLLPPKEQQVLWSLGRDKEYPPGMPLCVEGDPATHVFILLAGWVKILSVSEDGREFILAIRGAGDIVGDAAGQTTGLRSATMLTMGTVRALIVEHGRFSSFLDAHRGGSHAYRRVMAHRLSDAQRTLRVRAATNGAQRLADLLLGLAERVEGQVEGIIEIALPLSQDELASLAGTSRATVTRALDGWRKRGIIRTGQRRITLTDVPGLRRVAGPARAGPWPGEA